MAPPPPEREIKISEAGYFLVMEKSGVNRWEAKDIDAARRIALSEARYGRVMMVAKVVEIVAG